ncbi:MAG TPA: TadE family protein [Candidatus Dormibacteraeota bacterium]|nr:TadE family protein [Candidatus Dormibacteraeota bacterium]
MPNPHKAPGETTFSGRGRERGQSLVEFAVSSVVLLLLVGGLVDVGRAIYIQESLSNAVREAARHGVWFDAPSLSHPYLYDGQIKSEVDTELAAVNLPAATIKGNCPTPADGNLYHNPPYQSSFYPTAANQPWLYICYNNQAGLDYPSSPATNLAQEDLNVIVLYSYAPLTPIVTNQFGIFKVAANEHMTVQGS